MHDPHIRYSNDPGPLLRAQPRPRVKGDPRPVDIVCQGWLRYTLADMNDPDLRRLRADTVESGRHLFIVHAGDTGLKQIVEAYYPDEIRESYADHLIPHLKGDFEMGRLIVVNELFGPWFGEMDPRRIEEINRNARNVHSELKRTRAASYHARDLHNDAAAKEERPIKEWSDWYEDAYNETQKFAMGKPRVSAVTHRP